MKMFQKLTPENRQFIEKNKWPPDWYDMSFVLSNHIFVISDMLDASGKHVHDMYTSLNPTFI